MCCTDLLLKLLQHLRRILRVGHYPLCRTFSVSMALTIFDQKTLCVYQYICFDRQVKDPPLNIQDIPRFRHISRCFWYSQKNSNELCCKRLLMWILTFASLPHYLQNNYTRFCVNTLCKSVEAVLMNLYFCYLRVSYTYTMNNSYFTFINLSNPPPIPLKSVSFTLNTIFLYV